MLWVVSSRRWFVSTGSRKKFGKILVEVDIHQGLLEIWIYNGVDMSLVKGWIIWAFLSGVPSVGK
jgi:hypothetical protein